MVSDSADSMMARIIDSMTDDDYNIITTTLNEFEANYIESALPAYHGVMLDDETQGFSISHLTPKQRLYLKSIGYNVICKWDRQNTIMICTLNFK